MTEAAAARSSVLATVALDQAQFEAHERVLAEAAGVTISGFRFPTGVAALRLANLRGYVVVLPWMGQIVWDAVFDGVRLTMGSLFDAPRPAKEIIDTYGCLAFHSGLLRNGCPGPDDTHLLHGEMACAAMDRCRLHLGRDNEGDFVRVTSDRLFVRGFGNRYLAEASITLQAQATLFDIGMTVSNAGGLPMDLMYMCHVNFGFVAGGRIVQPAPFTAETVRVRAVIPAHVPFSPEYAARIKVLAQNPSSTELLDPAAGYDPEQVFYLHGLRAGIDGQTHLMVRRPQGDGFAMSFSQAEFPHVVRWLMLNADQQVAAFALPSTCEPEGYLAERRKGHVASIAPGETRAFSLHIGYLDAAAATAQEAQIVAARDQAEAAH